MLSIFLSSLTHGGCRPTKTAAAKLQNSMGENRAARRGLISRVNRFFHSVCSPVQLRFRSPAARTPHVVILLPSKRGP
nr:MAG TPA: hypothetical protein [Caudoviricetes sp.]